MSSEFITDAMTEQTADDATANVDALMTLLNFWQVRDPGRLEQVYRGCGIEWATIAYQVALEPSGAQVADEVEMWLQEITK